MDDAPIVIENSKVRMSRFWDTSTKHKWPKVWSSMEDPVVPLDRNLYGHPLAELLWERQFENVLLEHGWEKFSTGNVYLVIENKDCSYRYTWMITKKMERK